MTDCLIAKISGMHIVMNVAVRLDYFNIIVIG